jgi:YVTN family beta-propeller protein
MKAKLFVFTLIVVIAAFFTACDDSSTGPSVPDSSDALFVLNSLANSISVIDIETDQVFNDVAVVGIWPSQITYHDNKVYVVNSGSNNVEIFDSEGLAKLGTISLGAGNNPMSMVFLNNQKAYVACSESNTVKVLNLSNNSVTATINVGVGATGIAISNGKVYVANTAFDGSNYTYGQGTVSIIDTSNDTVIQTLNVPTNPQDVAVAPNGSVHVVCTGDYMSVSGNVVVINPATDTIVQTIAIGGSPGKIHVSENNIGYVGTFSDGVYTYNATTYAVINSPANPVINRGGSGIVSDLEGNIYIADFIEDQVVKLDSEHNLVTVFDVGDGPGSICVK